MYPLLLLVACSNLNLDIGYKPSATEIKALFRNLTGKDKEILQKWSLDEADIAEKYGVFMENKAIFVANQYFNNGLEKKAFYKWILNNILKSLENVIKRQQNKREFWNNWDTPVQKLRTLPYLIRYDFDETAKYLIQILLKEMPYTIAPELIPIVSEIDDASVIKSLSEVMSKNHSEAIINCAIRQDNYKIIDALDEEYLREPFVLKECFQGAKGLCLQRLWYRLNQGEDTNPGLLWAEDLKCVIKNEYIMMTVLEWAKYKDDKNGKIASIFGPNRYYHSSQKKSQIH